MTIPLISSAVFANARRKSEPNSPEIETVRRALQVALPHGAQRVIATAIGRTECQVAHQIEGHNALTADVLVEALSTLPEGERVRISRLALAPIHLFPAPLPACQKLLPAITPAAASVFPMVGHLAETAALAEADGTITEDEAAAIREEAEKASATLAAVVETAEVAAGKRLA